MVRSTGLSTGVEKLCCLLCSRSIVLYYEGEVPRNPSHPGEARRTDAHRSHLTSRTQPGRASARRLVCHSPALSRVEPDGYTPAAPKRPDDLEALPGDRDMEVIR